MAAIDVLNMSSVDHQSSSSTSSELLQSMVAGAVARTQSPNYSIKLEPDENDVEESESNASVNFMNSVTNSLFPSLNSHKLNSGTPLISTSGIARIPTELNSPSTSNEKSSIGYMQQLKRSRTRIFYNPASRDQPISISRPSTRYIHADCTVEVPRTDDLPRSNSAAKSPPSSPSVNSNKRLPTMNFATWLNEHFKLNGQRVQGKAQQINTRPAPQHKNASPKQMSQKEPCAKSLNSLPEFLIQFANKNAKTPTPGLISAARTVEIPINEEAGATTAQKHLENQINSRKSQRLLDKTEELRNRQTAICVQTPDRQYKELKGELTRIRKQMSRDRRRLIDECCQIREEFASLRQTILTALKPPQSSDLLNGKRHGPEDLSNGDEPISKRQC